MAKPTNNNVPSSGSKSITDYFSLKPVTRSKSVNSDGHNNTQKQQRPALGNHITPSLTDLSILQPKNRTQMLSLTSEANSHVEYCAATISETSSPARPSVKRLTNGADTVPKAKEAMAIVSEGGYVSPGSDPIPISSTRAVPPTPLSTKNNSMTRSDGETKNGFSSPNSSSMDEVPGSVSGEEEMECISRVKRNVESTKESVVRWRKESLPLSDMQEGMDIDEVLMSESDTDESLFGPEISTPPRSQQQPTPPPTTERILPPTPSPMDTAKKTEQLIAEIKARALAAAKSSQMEEEKAMPFKETLSESDSDDDLLPLQIDIKGKGKAKALMVPISAITTHHNTRSTQAHAKSKATSPTGLSSERRKGTTKKKHNPFTALLKEKRDEERSGRGDLDFLKAAQTMLPERQLFLEMEDEDGYDGFGNSSQKITSSLGKEVDDMNASLDDGDRRRLFGDQSQGIKDILDGEHKILEAGKRRETEIGVPLWTDNASSAGDDVNMDVEPTLDFGEYTKVPVLARLHDALKSNDQAQTITILNSGLLNMINMKGFPGVTSYLTYLALSPADISLSSAAFKALCNIWTTSRGSEPGITLQSILNAVSRLGAKSEFLNLAGSKPLNLNPGRRESLIFRLTKLIESCARPRLLKTDEIPEIVLILLAISLDPSTSAVLQNAIIVALDSIFQSIADSNVVADIEPIICTKILSYVQNLESYNISYLLTFLTGSMGRSTRIARWVARSVLLGKTEVTEFEYCHTPPVQDLSAILVQGTTTTCQAFQIKRDTDYIELKHHTQILAVALTDISSYLPSEIAAKSMIKAERSIQSSPSRDQAETPLEYLNRCLTSVQREITDNGTDIERSRTKAALHHLSMRLHYQLAVRKSDRSPNISAYLEKRKPLARRK